MNGIIAEYLFGKGIDVSREHTSKEAEHRYVEPGNLYLLRNETGVEVFDYLYSNGTINESKYFRILLYEWFIVVKKDGYICLEFEDNEILNSETLKKEISLLNIYRGRHRIVHDGCSGRPKTLVIQKTESCRRDENELLSWTFGIVTNGKRKDFIMKSIDSIRALNIPNYEIILCGTFDGELGDDTRYIPFSEKDDRGWITRKKNIICENASYENIVVIHDRINFPMDWHIGIKRWGNYFDVMSCYIYYPSVNTLKLNWDTMGFYSTPEKLNRLDSLSASLDPTDWDRHAIIGGPIIILKKTIWQQAKWDESLYWGDFEDIELSHRQSKKGVLLRFNPYLKVVSEIVTVPLMNFSYKKNSTKLGRLRINPVFLTMLKLLDFSGLRRNSSSIRWAAVMINRWQKTRNWKREVNAGAK